MSKPSFRPTGNDSHVIEYAKKDNKKYRDNYDKIDWSASAKKAKKEKEKKCEDIKKHIHEKNTSFKTHRTVLKCKSCKDEIWSRYSGEFRHCKCGDIAIDDTGYYYRAIGDFDTIEHLGICKLSDLKEKNNEKASK